MASVEPWLGDGATRHARLRLLCLPFAGGGVGMYRSWIGAAPAGVAVLPVQLPGRERRMGEPAYTSMKALVDDLVRDLSALLAEPWAVFGHSMGGAIAHALAVAATQAGVEPARLIVSARRAPGVAPSHPPLFALPRDHLIAEMQRRYGPLPEVLSRHPGLLDSFLPTMRADFRLLETWQAPEGRLLRCPLLTLAGSDDTAVPPASLLPWADATSGDCEHEVLPGGHFFARDATQARDRVMRALA